MAGVGLGRCVALLPGWDPRGVHILGVGVLIPGGGGRRVSLFLKCCRK